MTFPVHTKEELEKANDLFRRCVTGEKQLSLMCLPVIPSVPDMSTQPEGYRFLLIKVDGIAYETLRIESIRTGDLR